MRLSVSMLQAAALVSAAAFGWVLRGHIDGSAAGAAPRAESPRAAATHKLDPSTQPLIAVASDGRVTLRVEQQPLDWVLDEIAQQSGYRDPRSTGVAGATACAPTPATESCPVREEPPRPADHGPVLAAIENGSETERHDALLQARDEGVTLPPQLLRTLIETGASERVRLRALEAWVEQHADQPAAVRGMLEGVMLTPGTELTQEAQRLLGELQQAERVDPADTQPRSQP